MDSLNETPDFDGIYNCKHSIAVASVMLFEWKLLCRLNLKSSLVWIDLVDLLSQILSDRSFILKTNQWYLPLELNTKHDDGGLGIFVSTSYQILLVHLAFWDRERAKKKLGCFICPRSATCTHIAAIPRLQRETHPFFLNTQNSTCLGVTSASNIQITSQKPNDQAVPNQDNDSDVDEAGSDDDDFLQKESPSIYIPERDDPNFSSKVTEEGTCNTTSEEVLINYGAPMFSKLKYPEEISLDDELSSHIQDRMRFGIKNWLETNYPEKVIVCEISNCCNQPMTMCIPRNVTIYSLNGIFPDYSVVSGYCNLCSGSKHFDGRSVGLVNFGNSRLFFVELFYELLELKINSGLATSAWWKAKVAVHLMCYRKSELLQDYETKLHNLAGKINSMMIQFIKLIDYNPQIFQCCSNPKIVCVDGIVLSIRNDRLKAQNLKTPRIKPNSLNRRFSTRPNRQLVNFTKNEKEIMREYRRIGLSNSDWNSIIVSRPQNPVIRFLKSCNKTDSTLLPNKCDEMLVRFVHCLYKDLSPASIIAPSSCWVCLIQIEKDRRIHPKILEELQNIAPILGEVVLYISIFCQTDELKSISMKMLSFVLTASKANFESQNTGYRWNVEDRTENVQQETMTNPYEELSQTGYFFPGRPAVREINPILLNQKEPSCNKSYKIAGKFGSGTLFFWCAEHKCCIGFVVLLTAESVQHVYNVFVTRFIIQPEFIIYDNGCNLHDYILNRSPSYFQKTQILSDGFHWKNHKNCCECYNSKLYPTLDRNLLGY